MRVVENKSGKRRGSVVTLPEAVCMCQIAAKDVNKRTRINGLSSYVWKSFSCISFQLELAVDESVAQILELA